MPAPDRLPSATSSLSPDERQRVTRAALLRPTNLLMLLVGSVVFVAALPATSLAWLLVPLTLVTYASLVFLSSRDPILRQRVLGGGPASPVAGVAAPPARVSPDRRARWLPRGETREKVEAALASYRSTVKAIEESDDVTREVLEDAVPKLHAAADRLVDVAHRREKAASTVRDLRSENADEARESTLREIEEEVRKADAEISATSEQFLTLRARIVRVSLDATAATDLNSSLDELNMRLEALASTMSPARETTEDL